MLISKENTAKSKYTLEFHSLRAPPWKPPRRESKVEDETSTTLRKGSSEGEGSPTCPAFTAFVYPLRGERFTVVKLVKTALPSTNSIFVRLSSEQPVYRNYQRLSTIKMTHIIFNLCRRERNFYEFYVSFFQLIKRFHFPH